MGAEQQEMERQMKQSRHATIALRHLNEQLGKVNGKIADLNAEKSKLESAIKSME